MAESDSGPGTWLATYADFITLLMCFFVALYSLTSGISKSEFEAFVSIFQGSKSVLKQTTVVKNKTISTREQRLENWRKFKKVIKKNSWQDDVKFEVLPSGVKITLGEDITFETYSAILVPEAKKLLHVVAYSIDNYTEEPLKIVEVIGHTDGRPIVGKAGKFANNWELGAARAISVVQFLIRNSITPPKRFQAVTFGKYRPVANNKTKKGRRKNRRVEIFVKYIPTNSAAVEKDSGLSSSVK